jgi:hypothetical protein
VALSSASPITHPITRQGLDESTAEELELDVEELLPLFEGMESGQDSILPSEKYFKYLGEEVRQGILVTSIIAIICDCRRRHCNRHPSQLPPQSHRRRYVSLYPNIDPNNIPIQTTRIQQYPPPRHSRPR